MQLYVASSGAEEDGKVLLNQEATVPPEVAERLADIESYIARARSGQLAKLYVRLSIETSIQLIDSLVQKTPAIRRTRNDLMSAATLYAITDDASAMTDAEMTERPLGRIEKALGRYREALTHAADAAVRSDS